MDDEPRLSGAIFLNNLVVYRQFLGDEVVRRAIDGLSEDARNEVGNAVAAAWVRASTVDATYFAIAHEAGEDVEALYRRVVRGGVERTLKTVWRWLLRLTSDRALVSRTPLIYARGHDTGKLVSTIPEPGRAQIELTGWPEIPHLRLVGVAEGIGTVLRLAGRRDVEFDFERTPDGARFGARWRV